MRIIIKDKSPEKQGSYLVFTDNQRICVWMWIANVWLKDGVGTEYATPTHWMYLPEPPKI